MEENEILENEVPEEDLQEDPEEVQEEDSEENLEENENEDPAVTYEVDLSSIEALIQENNDLLLQNTENTYRLYYFVGGLYVVFMIILVIKFFKQFF